MKDTNDRILPPAFRALADPTRLKILLMLEGKPRTVNEIVEFFDLSQPTISRHLQTLASADLVVREQHGREVTYRINPDRISNLCISLAACFPCCCVTVTSAGAPSQTAAGPSQCDTSGTDSPPSAGRRRPSDKTEQTTNTRSRSKRKKQSTKRKGDTR